MEKERTPMVVTSKQLSSFPTNTQTIPLSRKPIEKVTKSLYIQSRKLFVLKFTAGKQLTKFSYAATMTTKDSGATQPLMTGPKKWLA